MKVRRLAGLVAVVVLTMANAGGMAGADAATPTVSGPVPGPPFVVGHTELDLASVGYQQEEYFFEGTANAYAPTAPLTTDGRWSVSPSTPAPYVSRLVVNRPIRERDFSGTVFVEWLNVSGGIDASPDWVHSHVELIRAGHAWVGVTAQAVGANALKSPPLDLTADTTRYTAITHPGDSYSYDIFSQAGQAVRDHADQVLGGFRPRRVLAMGESQSAGRLTTYVNAVHPLVEVYDGFFIHSRGAAGSPLSQDPLPAVTAPTPTLIRDDLDVPVLVLQTENDAGGLQARRDDSSIYRLWEVAGSAHYDQYGLSLGATDTGKPADYVRWFEAMQHPSNQPVPIFTCALPVNAGPQTFVVRAAVRGLDAWVRDGKAPPRAPRLETASIDPLRYELDEHGNARGGIRTPAVDAPIATLGGQGNSGEGPIGRFCGLFGTTVPFTADRLAEEYGNQRGFARAWNRAVRDAVRAGFVLPEDGKGLRAVPNEVTVVGER